MVRKENVRFPDNVDALPPSVGKRVNDGDIRQMALSGSCKAAVQGHFESICLRMPVGKHGCGLRRAHCMAAGRSASYLV